MQMIKRKSSPRNTHEKLFPTHEISTTKKIGAHELPARNFWPTKYPLDTLNSHEGTMTRWHYTHENHDSTPPTKFSTLDFCFVDKNKDVQRSLAANIESLVDTMKDNIGHKNLKLHELLRWSTDIFINSVYSTKEIHIHRKFIHRKFYNYEQFKNLKPDSSQTACLYGIAKTHKLENLEEITLANLKFWPIIDHTGTILYNAGKVISDYLEPSCKNECFINDTQKFASMLSSIPLLQEDEEDLSYVVESLFTNIPIIS